MLLGILFHRQADQLHHLAGVRLVGGGDGDRSHRIALVVVDDPLDGSVGDNNLVALHRAQIGHPHGGRLHRSLHIVDFDVVPDRELVFENHKHPRHHVPHQVLRTKTDGKASDSGGEQQVAQWFSHS